ncbi:ABC transporter ATP-binding protein [Chitinophagaceae bacterium MMS25-I14]
MKKFTRIFGYLKDYKFQITLYFIFNVLGIVFGLFSLGALVPILNVLFLNGGTGTSGSGKDLLSVLNSAVSHIVKLYGSSTALLYICFGVVVLTVLKNLFLYLSRYMLNPIRNAVLRRLRDEMYLKMLSLPIGFFTEERKGDLISRMTNDVNEVELSIMATLEVIIREPLTILFYIGSMIYISPSLTIFLVVFLPVAGLVIGRIGKSLRKSSNVLQELLGSMLGIIDETLVGMRVVKAFNAEKHQHSRFMKVNNMMFRTRNKLATRSELGSPLSETMGIMVVSVVLWYGGQLIFSNSSSLDPAKFILYIGLFSQIITPFKNISTSVFNIQKGAAALERVEHLLVAENTIQELPDARPVKDFNKAVEFKNVRFSYGDKVILDGIDLKIEKGKTIALVGASGAGKSTMVDLIPRFHDVTSGEILIDGINVKDLKLDDVRRLMGVVSQDPILFNDTIENNIRLGTGGASIAQVEEAATVAHAHSFIMNKPDGYQTVVGDRGSRLSGGERQRVTIARAVLKNPPILILDEATSSLDTESERIVQEAINKLMQNRTCIVIAHRLSTVQHADEIIVMDRGKIVQRGRHAELMQTDGLYRKLVEMQQVK